MKRFLVVTLFAFGVALATVSAQGLPGWAAPSGSSGAPEAANAPPPPPPPEQVPIDGGLALLGLAGAGYAVKRLRARN
jgi:hypothetical protein